jgi:peptidoglycan hydrolase-like protein with peptidoglycan-binding domain
MLLANKVVWTAMAFALLTTGILVQAFPQSRAGSDSNTEGVTVFVVKNEIKKVQETLRAKGYYSGKVDSVFGLRTRASIRAYQKAESLPITGEVDTKTAAALGVRPESNWHNPQNTERQIGPGSDIVVGEFERAKPSAGIRRTVDSERKTARREISRATAVEDKGESGAEKQRTENEEHYR